MIRKKDLVLFLSLLLVAALGFLILFFLRGDGTGEWEAVIEQNGAVIARLPLSENADYPVSCEDGENLVRIEDGAVFVVSADCKNQVCVLHGKLTPAYADTDFISCAPHHLLIYLERAD